uniref:hypothetical protein n=1 Tax=Carnobacterium sp. TaxID=48221 RepID=UPI0028B0759A
KLINEIEDYEITVMLARPDKTLLPLINKNIHLVELYKQGLGLNMGLYLKRSLKKGKLLKGLWMFLQLYRYIILDQFEQLNQQLLDSYDVCNEEYDVAIAYDGGSRNSLTPKKLKQRKK